MAGDPTEVASHVYQTILENDKVRVLAGKLAPGDTTVMHTHPDHVAVVLSDCSIKFTTGGGETMEVSVKAGEAIFVEGGDHATENTSGTELRAVLIELK
ncbi:MAG TPA: cupin domain-containing protein [Dehalococcoidia bacterium]|nr:cupin domain-containing protein [Dehalococcoidia bacterium]